MSHRPTLLLLSPHPDDLVFSAFSALTRSETRKLAVIYFNVSKFTRWKIKSKALVSVYRTLEDSVILSFLGARALYFFLKDNSVEIYARSSIESSSLQEEEQKIVAKFSSPSNPVDEIYCPLGIGGNPDHLFVRSRGIKLHEFLKKKPDLFFYEDLPYGARRHTASSSFEEEKRCLDEISSTYSVVAPVLKTLTSEQMKRKLYASRAYLSQNDHRELIIQRARILGQGGESGFAEKHFLAR